MYPFTWISDGYHVKNATLSCFNVFHVYFSHGLLVYLSTCKSGEYQVKSEPRFPSYVYSTCVFNFLRVLGGLSVWVIIHVEIITHLKLWVAVARHSFKCVKISTCIMTHTLRPPSTLKKKIA